MQNENKLTISEEISLKDIVGFLKRNQWLIIFCGFAGLLFSTAYLVLSANKYEARWQVHMAQVINNREWL